MVVQCDVGDPAVSVMFERTGELGALDILVNNAGEGLGGTPVADMEDARLELILWTDLMGPLFCARELILLRRTHGGKGRIVNISSVTQHLPTPGSAPTAWQRLASAR